MIDYLFSFPDEATAQADPVVGQYYRTPSTDNAGGWRADVVLTPQVFDGTVDINGNLIALPQFFVWVALSQSDDALLSDTALVIAANRHMANMGMPDAVLRTTLTQDQLATFSISPVIAGAKAPFGASS